MTVVPDLRYTYVCLFLCCCPLLGGADGRYTFVGSSDLRPYKLKSGAAFIMQVCCLFVYLFGVVGVY